MYKLNISKMALEQHLSCLPISYYLKAVINVGITYEECSYYNQTKNYIMISLPQINSIMFKKKPNNDEIERCVRPLLYHEISHALLTCKDDVIIDSRVLNIFEDQRIETLMDGFFKDTDFKTFVRMVNNYDSSIQPRNEMEYFYKVVRFGDGKEEFVKRVNQIIYNARFLTSSISMGENNYSFNDYQMDVKELYEECKKYFLENFERTKEVEEETIKITVESIDKNEAQNNIKEDQKTLSKKKLLIDEIAKDLGISTINLLRSIHKSIGGIITNSKHDNEAKIGDCKKDFRRRLEEIINSVKSKYRIQSKTISSYSGRISPRLTINKDYKWFLRPNNGDNNGFSSKLHLNLFIDQSGSFTPNEEKVNKILSELDSLENSLKDKFTYKLITMDEQIKIKDDKKRRISCDGCTHLDKSWKDVFDKVQDVKSECYNLVLFDGKCYTNQDAFVFSIFNRNNTVIISDMDNEYPIRKFCPNVRKAVIVDDGEYVDKLVDNIINTLKILVR